MREMYNAYIMGTFVVATFVFAILIGDNLFLLTGYSIYIDNSEVDFDNGGYYNTVFLSSYVTLSGTNTSGSFTSQVFGGPNSVWNNISWDSNAIGELLDNAFNETLEGGIDMRENLILLHLNNDSAYGEDETTVNDFSGNNFDGTIYGGPSSDPGRVGSQGFSFDGVDDYIGLQEQIELERTDSFSIGFWIKRNGAPSGVQFIASKKDPLGNRDGWGIYLYDQDYPFLVMDNHYSTSRLHVHGTRSVVDNSWHHVLVTYDGSSSANGVTMYIDGVSDSMTILTDTLSGTIKNDIELQISGRDGSASQVFGGELDEFAIWNRTLTSTEASNLYKRGLQDLDLQVRSCDDISCVGESFFDVADKSFVDLAISNNTYFQYRFNMSTLNTSFSPKVFNVTVDYTALNSAPTLTLEIPQNILYLSNESLELNYTVVDPDSNLDSCFYNINNGANISLSGCLNSTFNVPGDGNYDLYLYSNDTLGYLSIEAVNFDVDATGVFVSISQPTGTKTSRINIALDYTSVGVNATCIYNVETSIGGNIISNTSLSGCSGSTFDVSVDGDYVVNMFVNNSLGSHTSSFSSFTVDTTSPGEESGSSGGSSGSSIIGGSGLVLSAASFVIDPVSAIMSIGEEKSLGINVRNKGRTSANGCTLVPAFGFEDYFESDLISNIGVGELISFPIVVSAVDYRVGDMIVNMVCLDDVRANLSFDITLLEYELDVSIDSISFVSNKEILVEYSLSPNSDFNEDILFRILDSTGETVLEEIRYIEAIANEEFNGEISFDLSPVEEGLLKISVYNSDEFLLREEAVIYGGNTITGFAITGVSGEGLMIVSIALSFVMLSSFVGFRIFKLRRDESPRIRDLHFVRKLRASSVQQALELNLMRNKSLGLFKGRRAV